MKELPRNISSKCLVFTGLSSDEFEKKFPQHENNNEKDTIPKGEPGSIILRLSDSLGWTIQKGKERSSADDF